MVMQLQEQNIQTDKSTTTANKKPEPKAEVDLGGYNINLNFAVPQQNNNNNDGKKRRYAKDSLVNGLISNFLKKKETLPANGSKESPYSALNPVHQVKELLEPALKKRKKVFGEPGSQDNEDEVENEFVESEDEDNEDENESRESKHFDGMRMDNEAMLMNAGLAGFAGYPYNVSPMILFPEHQNELAQNLSNSLEQGSCVDYNFAPFAGLFEGDNLAAALSQPPVPNLLEFEIQPRSLFDEENARYPIEQQYEDCNGSHNGKVSDEVLRIIQQLTGPTPDQPLGYPLNMDPSMQQSWQQFNKMLYPQNPQEEMESRILQQKFAQYLIRNAQMQPMQDSTPQAGPCVAPVSPYAYNANNLGHPFNSQIDDYEKWFV